MARNQNQPLRRHHCARFATPHLWLRQSGTLVADAAQPNPRQQRTGAWGSSERLGWTVDLRECRCCVAGGRPPAAEAHFIRPRPPESQRFVRHSIMSDP